jgi:hypothetical protein
MLKRRGAVGEGHTGVEGAAPVHWLVEGMADGATELLDWSCTRRGVAGSGMCLVGASRHCRSSQEFTGLMPSACGSHPN